MNKAVVVIVGLIIIVLAVGTYTMFFSKPTGQLTGKDAFAQCITEKGATFYGAEWCGYCDRQKALLGNSMQYINYVECPQNQDLCNRMGVQAYPTWIINGQKYTGVKTLQELAQLTGCSLS